MIRLNQNYQVPTGALVAATAAGAAFNLPVQDYSSFAISYTTTLDSGSGNLDLYLQTLGLDGNWYDVVHFAQVSAAVTTAVWARITVGGSAYVGAVGSKTIAASSLGVPPLSNTFRINQTVTSTASYTPTINIWLNEIDRGGL